MRTVIVTGVSTGIGHGVAKVLLERGFRVCGSVRNKEDAERLGAEWGESFTALQFDITDERAVKESAAVVEKALAGETLSGLVNNAGVAVPGPLIYLPIDDFRRQIEVNLTGALIVTQAFVGLLRSDEKHTGRPGRIVNISSIGGRMAGPFLGAYSASKFALEGLSESLRRELMIHGIDVIVVGPGAVSTPIWDKAEQLDTSPFEKTEYARSLESFRSYMLRNGRNGYPAERIGRVVAKALTASNPRTRYGFSVVPQPLRNWVIPQLVSKRTADRFVARSLGLNPKRPN
ncbi:MAG TPA: SDR family oxidoreductase [Spirochaetia bacterium]|nr:SDR family oxidoreductase [Spirochaetia bacterium]